MRIPIYLFFIFTVSCAEGPVERERSSHYTQQDTDDLNISNGRELEDHEWNAVVRVTVASKGSCSATIVAHNAIITADHCFNNKEDKISVQLSTGEKIKPTAVHFNDEAKKHRGPFGEYVAVDVAILKFPDGTLRDFYAHEIQLENPLNHHQEIPVDIVGYGLAKTGGPYTGIKRQGANTISKYERAGAGGFFTISGTSGYQDGSGENSTGLSGDSGGPVFYQNKLLGVTSSGYSSKGEMHTQYASLQSEYMIEFLKKHGIIDTAAKDASDKLRGLFP